mmetsp:Transcript_13091/g.33200  ORF Transcript_13091/g.33200 Transcript_13091/m.33200 type:complete len:398 (-) Transcript_13091:92-1285(-)
MQPRRHCPEHQAEPLRKATRVVLAQPKLDGVEARLDDLLRQPRADHVLKEFNHERLHLIRAILGHTFQTDGEKHLAEVSLETGADEVLADLRVDEGLVERGAGVGEQHVPKDAVRKKLRRGDLIDGREHPVQSGHVFLRDVAVRAGVVAELEIAGLRPRLLQRDLRERRGLVGALEFREELVGLCEAHFFRIVTVEPQPRVGRVVVCLVEALELLPGEVWNVTRVPAGLDTVGGIGKERAHGVLAEAALRVGVRALHLVVDDALDGDGPIDVVDLEVVALLAQSVRGEARVKDGVHVNVHKVVKVLEVAARNGVARFVRVRHRVEECVEGGLDELDKGLLARVLSGAAEHGMLEDMRDAGGVGRGGTEHRAEGLVLVRRGQRKQLSTGLLVHPQPRR